MRFRDLLAEFIRAEVGMDPAKPGMLLGTECVRLSWQQEKAIRFLRVGANALFTARRNTWAIVVAARYVGLRFHWTYSQAP
jgi:hypothetical protein